MPHERALAMSENSLARPRFRSSAGRFWLLLLLLLLLEQLVVERRRDRRPPAGVGRGGLERPHELRLDMGGLGPADLHGHGKLAVGVALEHPARGRDVVVVA